MIVWLWDACGPGRGGCGVTSDRARAVRAAEGCLRGGHAVVARVESALIVMGTQSLTFGYLRTGEGLTGRGGDTGVRWEPLTELPAS